MIGNRTGAVKGLFWGIIVGFLIGSVVVAAAAMSKDGWFKREPQFRLGYLTGFNDAVRMAKSANRGGYLDSQYRLPPGAKPLDWLGETNAMYLLEENSPLTILQLLARVGPKLEQRFGLEDAAGGSMALLGEVLAHRRAAIESGEIPLLTEEQLKVRAIHNRRVRKENECRHACRKGCVADCGTEIKAEFDESEEKALRAAEESVRERDAHKKKAE